MAFAFESDATGSGAVALTVTFFSLIVTLRGPPEWELTFFICQRRLRVGRPVVDQSYFCRWDNRAGWIFDSSRQLRSSEGLANSRNIGNRNDRNDLANAVPAKHVALPWVVPKLERVTEECVIPHCA